MIRSLNAVCFERIPSQPIMVHDTYPGAIAHFIPLKQLLIRLCAFIFRYIHAQEPHFFLLESESPIGKIEGPPFSQDLYQSRSQD